jgi:hypothetical protein
MKAATHVQRSELKAQRIPTSSKSKGKNVARKSAAKMVGKK